MRLGILHQRVRPGAPQENGAHERMHRTLKREAIKPVRGSCTAQQRNFDAFRREYNVERPHEYLGQETPASQYISSPRPYPDRLPTPEYPRHFLVKKITTGGTSASAPACYTSPMRWSINTSVSRRRTTACGRFTSTACC
jgi:putative transposase